MEIEGWDDLVIATVVYEHFKLLPLMAKWKGVGFDLQSKLDAFLLENLGNVFASNYVTNFPNSRAIEACGVTFNGNFRLIA